MTQALNLTVTCVKVGTRYGPEYVNRLASMVARHTTLPHRFLCLTDDPRGLDCDTADIGTDLPGWWAKLILFKPHPKLEGHRVVFLDLDTVIVDNIDFLLEYDGPFAILRDFYWPKGYGSAIMSIAPGFGQQVWDQFQPEYVGRYPGDQDWIRRLIPHADLWQDIAPKKIVSYKVDVLPARRKGEAVVCFHGEPKPCGLLLTDPLRIAWEAV